MTEPFHPIGERARWRVLVDLFREVPRGEVVTYDTLAETLELDASVDRKAIRAAVRQASRPLSVEHARSVIAVRGRGYRVALPDEHVDLAAAQQKRSSRALSRGRQHVDHVDLSAMSEDGKRLVAAAAAVLGYQQQQIRKLDLRQRDLESAMDSVTNRVEQTPTREETEARLADLQRQIDKLEGR